MSKLHNAEEDWENYSTFRIHEVRLTSTESVFQKVFCTSHNWKVLYVSSRDRSYTQVVQVARFLDSIASNTPEMLRGVLAEVGENQSEKDQAVGRKLDELLSKLDTSRLNIEKVAKKSIRSSGDEKEKISSAVLWGAAGALFLSTFLFQFVYVPMQLRQARGAEGASIEGQGR
jgi:hypothetical protein